MGDFKLRNLVDILSLESQKEVWAGDTDLGIMRLKSWLSHVFGRKKSLRKRVYSRSS